MTISRGQMNRQLYMGGGIMDVVPREQYGFGSIFKGVTKAVKKVAGGVKDIASSDLGKMALLAAGAYYTGGALGGTGGFNNFATLGSVLKNKAAGMVPKLLKGKSGINLGITALGGLFGGAMAGKSEEEVEALTRDVPALKSYLTQYYTNLNPELRNQPEKVEQFVNSQIAEYNQGRGGYAMGGRMQYGDGTMSPDEYFSGKEKYMKQKQMDDMYREYKEYIRDKNMKRDEAANGGRMQYALGDTASQNAMQAAGIEGLPMRQNPKGVQELDLRDNGGFIPPVGIKEKEDDIPAMLSNNEFVFTADAVRGMGDGDVELGAQRMYDQMKTLEEGGRV